MTAEHRAVGLAWLVADAARGDRRYDVCEQPVEDGPLFARLVVRDQQGREYAITVEHMPPAIRGIPRGS